MCYIACQSPNLSSSIVHGDGQCTVVIISWIIDWVPADEIVHACRCDWRKTGGSCGEFKGWAMSLGFQWIKQPMCLLIMMMECGCKSSNLLTRHVVALRRDFLIVIKTILKGVRKRNVYLCDSVNLSLLSCRPLFVSRLTNRLGVFILSKFNYTSMIAVSLLLFVSPRPARIETLFLQILRIDLNSIH